MLDRLRRVEQLARQIKLEIVERMEPLGPDDRLARSELQGLLDEAKRFEQQASRVLQAREDRWMQRARNTQQSRLVDLERTGQLARQVRRAENGMSPRPTRLG